MTDMSCYTFNMAFVGFYNEQVGGASEISSVPFYERWRPGALHDCVMKTPLQRRVGDFRLFLQRRYVARIKPQFLGFQQAAHDLAGACLGQGGSEFKLGGDGDGA